MCWPGLPLTQAVHPALEVLRDGVHARQHLVLHTSLLLRCPSAVACLLHKGR